jgi:hypothetical protein
MQHPDERSQGGDGRPGPPLEKARERLRFFLEQRDLPPDEAGSSDVEPPLRRSLARAHARAGPPGTDAAAPTGPLAADASEYSESPYLTAAHEAHPKAAPRGSPSANASAAAAPPAAPAWQWLGPALIPRGQTFGTGPGSRPSVSGRVAAIAVDPGNRRHLLVGSAAGGVWESFDTGATWAPRTDAQATLAIGALAFTPANPAVVYAGTGEGNFFSRLGTGLLRSTDGGTTWSLRATAPFVGTGFYDLVVDRANPNRLLAATTALLAESTDGGAHWSQRIPQRTWSLSPGAAGEVLAACAVGVMRSTDGGTTWAPVPLPGGPARYQRLAVCQASGSPGVAYAAGVDFAGGAYLWRRAAAGGAFAAEPLPPELKVANASYHWCAAVKPNDPNVLYLGSFDLHRGRRGTGGWAWGWNWSNLSSRANSGDSIHVDQHAVAFDPADPAVVYAGNDGGLYRSADEGIGWASLNRGLGITEFEYMTQDPGNAAWIMGGTQDNGTLLRGAGLTWEVAAMGDGGDCGVNEAAPATCFHSYFSMGMERSTSGGGEGTWSAVGPFPAAGYDSLFYPPLEVNGATVAQAGQTVFVSADQGTSWAEVALNAGQRVSALAVVSATRILAGTNGGRIFRLDRAAAGWAGATVTALASPRQAYVSDLFVDPRRPNEVWLAYSDLNPLQHVFFSTDGGATWSSRSGAGSGLPTLPANAVAVDPANPARVFVALDLQVYQSLNGGASWAMYGTGLPNALVGDIAVHAATRRLRAATRSRGMWEIPI